MNNKNNIPVGQTIPTKKKKNKNKNFNRKMQLSSNASLILYTNENRQKGIIKCIHSLEYIRKRKVVL